MTGINVPTVTREQYAQAIYDAQHPREGAAWLTTVDGTPNVASYAAADAIIALQAPTLAEPEKLDDGSRLCQHCGEIIRRRYGHGWMHLKTVYARCASSSSDENDTTYAAPREDSTP